MEYNLEQEKLNSYLQKHSSNIYDLIASLSILRTIDEFSEKINDDGHGTYYYFIQKQMVNSSILSLIKLFDTNSNSVSFKKINDHILYQYRELPLQQSMNRYNVKNFNIFTKNDLLKINNTFQLANYLSSQLESINVLYQDDLSALKDVRDKHIAHTDKRVIKSRTTWDKVDELVLFLLDYLELVSFILLSIAWSGDGDTSCLILKDDAERPSRSLKRIFKKLEYSEG